MWGWILIVPFVIGLLALAGFAKKHNTLGVFIVVLLLVCFLPAVVIWTFS